MGVCGIFRYVGWRMLNEIRGDTEKGSVIWQVINMSYGPYDSPVYKGLGMGYEASIWNSGLCMRCRLDLYDNIDNESIVLTNQKAIKSLLDVVEKRLGVSNEH